ncbi:hypothetical protein ACWX0P_28635 [Vibrio mediterranei]
MSPKDESAKDIGISPQGGFSGITLTQNVNASKDVLTLLQKAKLYGGNIVKERQQVFGVVFRVISPIQMNIYGKLRVVQKNTH